MSIAVEFHNWSTHFPVDDPTKNRCSPNLVELGRFLGQRWAMTNNGCYIERDIRGGSSPSAHSHGAATDRNYLNRLVAKAEIIPWMIDNSHELHLQAIHDYFGSRIWRAGRTSNTGEAHTTWWRTNTTASGMGESWATYFHFETNLSGWDDARPISDRLTVPVPPPNPTPTPPGAISVVFTRIIKPGDSGADVAFVQTVIRAPGAPSGNKLIIVDGGYGAQTVQAVKNIQAFTGLVADGIIGPKTQAVFMQLANS